MRWSTWLVRRLDRRYRDRDYRPGPGVLAEDGTKHLALRARSTNSRKASFTAPGLGDRIHCVTLGWVFSQAHSVPVVLHLTKKKQVGGQFGNKRESWFEVLDLFPKGSVDLMLHDYEPDDEPSWIAYLADKGIPAETYWYQDYPGRFAKPEVLDMSHYLKDVPLLPAVDVGADLDLPEQFVTVQWDSNEAARTIPKECREDVLAEYRRAGFEAVVVGGESENPLLKNSLRHIAYAMSKARFHVGVDSAFMHMAFLYFRHEDVHLYNLKDGFRSHHLHRALDCGCVLNLHFDER